MQNNVRTFYTFKIYNFTDCMVVTKPQHILLFLYVNSQKPTVLPLGYYNK